MSAVFFRHRQCTLLALYHRGGSIAAAFAVGEVQCFECDSPKNGMDGVLVGGMSAVLILDMILTHSERRAFSLRLTIFPLPFNRSATSGEQ